MNQRATKSGADKTHGVTRQKQAGPVPAREKSAVKTQESMTRVIRLEKRRATLRVLSGKKASLGKTYKTQTEANDKVWDTNRKTEKALDTVAILYGRFEQVSKDLGEVDHTIDKEFEELQDTLDGQKQVRRLVAIAAQAVHASRVVYHRLSGSCEVAENDLNEELGCVRVVVGKTSAAASALSYGTNDGCPVFD